MEQLVEHAGDDSGDFPEVGDPASAGHETDIDGVLALSAVTLSVIPS